MIARGETELSKDNYIITGNTEYPFIDFVSPAYGYKLISLSPPEASKHVKLKTAHSRESTEDESKDFPMDFVFRFENTYESNVTISFSSTTRYSRIRWVDYT